MGQRSDEVDREHLRQALEQDIEPALSAESADEPAEIRAEIEQTRSQMGETIDAIQARLNPQHIGEQVKEQVKEQFHEVTATVRDATIGRAEQMIRNAGDSITEARYGLVETIKHNPIPAAMTAIGLGWLLMNRRSTPERYYDDRDMRRRSERYYAGEAAYPYRPGAPEGYASDYQRSFYDQERERQRNQGLAQRTRDTASGVAGQARDAAGNVAGQARDAAGNVAEQARDAAGNLAGHAQYQARRVERTFHGSLDDNPLGVAAVALALGAAIGFGLPQTERENQLMGEARDSFVEKAQEVAESTAEKVQRVAGETADTAQQTARERAREQGLAGEQRRS